MLHGAAMNSGKAFFAPADGICWLAVESLTIGVVAGEAISTPTTMKSRYGDTLAVVFGQHKESPEDDRMLVVNLDPNRDGRFDDAQFKGAIDVGPNQMVGHSGYHAATMLPDRRHLAITNPGDGSLWVISLSDLNVVAKLDLDGTPSRLLAVGG